MSDAPPEWTGHVTDVDGDMFTVELYREGGSCGVLADFSMSECGLPGIRPGDLVTATPESVRLMELPAWTQEEVDGILARAREEAAEFRRLTGLDGETGPIVRPPV